MNIVEKLKVIEEMPMGELLVRRQMINGAIMMCIKAQAERDADLPGMMGVERMEEAVEKVGGLIERYREQLGRIDAEISKRKQSARKAGDGLPESITVNAQVGRLSAKG